MLKQNANDVALKAIDEFHTRFNANSGWNMRPMYVSWLAMQNLLKQDETKQKLTYHEWCVMVNDLIRSVVASLQTESSLKKERSFFQEDRGMQVRVDVVGGTPDEPIMVGHCTALIVMEELIY